MPLPKVAATPEAHFEKTKDAPVEYPRWVNREGKPPVQAISAEHEAQLLNPPAAPSPIPEPPARKKGKG